MNKNLKTWILSIVLLIIVPTSFAGMLPKQGYGEAIKTTSIDVRCGDTLYSFPKKIVQPCWLFEDVKTTIIKEHSRTLNSFNKRSFEHDNIKLISLDLYEEFPNVDDRSYDQSMSSMWTKKDFNNIPGTVTRHSGSRGINRQVYKGYVDNRLSKINRTGATDLRVYKNNSEQRMSYKATKVNNTWTINRTD